MPQLTFETFISQYFWLLVIIGVIYYLLVTKFLPSISEVIKARKVLENQDITQKNIENTDQSKQLIKDIVNNAIIKKEKEVKSNDTAIYKKNFNKYFAKIIKNKKIKKINTK
jgi:predicted hydrolase (HD superfamily)